MLDRKQRAGRTGRDGIDRKIEIRCVEGCWLAGFAVCRVRVVRIILAVETRNLEQTKPSEREPICVCRTTREGDCRTPPEVGDPERIIWFVPSSVCGQKYVGDCNAQ